MYIHVYVHCSAITNTSIQYNYKGYVTNVINTLLHVV